MIFAAMVEHSICGGNYEGFPRKITVSIIDCATKWKCHNVIFLPDPTEEEIQIEIADAADTCARAYGYFLATI
jgi:hypothetical protein